MSLKWFHLIFIAASVALALLVAVWGFNNGHPVLGALAVAGGAGLILYRNSFLAKTRSIK